MMFEIGVYNKLVLFIGNEGVLGVVIDEWNLFVNVSESK